MPRTAARISRSSSVGISSSRATPPGRLPVPGVPLRELELGLHGLALVRPLEALLQVRNRLLRAAGAVERRAQVVERVGVVDVLAVLGPGRHSLLQDRHGAGVVALLHQRVALLVQLGAALRVERTRRLLRLRLLLGRRRRLGGLLLLGLRLLLLPLPVRVPAAVLLLRRPVRGLRLPLVP